MGNPQGHMANSLNKGHQGTCLQVFEKQMRVTGFATWIMTSTVNLCLEDMRRLLMKPPLATPWQQEQWTVSVLVPGPLSMEGTCSATFPQGKLLHEPADFNWMDLIRINLTPARVKHNRQQNDNNANTTMNLTKLRWTR